MVDLEELFYFLMLKFHVSVLMQEIGYNIYILFLNELEPCGRKTCAVSHRHKLSLNEMHHCDIVKDLFL